MDITIITIIALSLAALLTIIDKYYKGFEKSRFVLIRLLPFIIIIVALTFSIVSESLRNQAEKEASSQRELEYQKTINYLDKIKIKGDESVQKLTGLKQSAQELNDSLAEDIKVQKEMNIASIELLAKNREMYINAQKEVALRRKNYEKEIEGIVISVTRISNEVIYKLSSPRIDSTIKMQRLAEICIRLSDILNPGNYNPVLLGNPLLKKHWISLDSTIERLNWPLTWYGTMPIEEIKNNLSLSMRQFLAAFSLYSYNNNGSFEYPPSNPSILPIFD